MHCFHILVYVLFVYVSVYADTFAYYIYNVCIYVANILTLCYPHIFSLAVFNSKACYFISVLYLWFLKFVYYLYISFPRTFYPLVCIFSFVATPFIQFISVQFSSVAQSCPTVCDPMNCSTPGFPVHHQLPEFT